MTATVVDQLLRKLESLDQMPSLPVVVSQLLKLSRKAARSTAHQRGLDSSRATTLSPHAACISPTRHFSGAIRRWTRSTLRSLRWGFAA